MLHSRMGIAVDANSFLLFHFCMFITVRLFRFRLTETAADAATPRGDCALEDGMRQAERQRGELRCGTCENEAEATSIDFDFFSFSFFSSFVVRVFFEITPQTKCNWTSIAPVTAAIEATRSQRILTICCFSFAFHCSPYRSLPFNRLKASHGSISR